MIDGGGSVRRAAKRALSSLADLEYSKMETTFLRLCPKLAFSLHTCPPSHLGQVLGTFDDAMLEG